MRRTLLVGVILLMTGCGSDAASRALVIPEITTAAEDAEGELVTPGDHGESADLCATNEECDDSNPCTLETCASDGSCESIPIDCGDNDPCTTDTCDPGTGSCLNEPVVCQQGGVCNPESGVCDVICPAEELQQVTWRLESFGPVDGEQQIAPPDEPYTLRFLGDLSIEGDADCNNCDESYYEVGPECSISIRLRCTEIGCGTLFYYAESVIDTSSFEVDNGTLRLYYVDRFSGMASALIYHAE